MTMSRRLHTLMLLMTVAGLAACAREATSSDQAAPLTVGNRSTLLVPAPADALAARVDSRLASASGTVQVWVSLKTPSVASFRARLAAEAQAATGTTTVARRMVDAPTRALVAEHGRTLRAAQDSLGARLAQLGARELARVSIAHSAIAIEVDAAQLSKVAALDDVAKVRPVIHYEMDLAETVPYVGGTAVQQAGFDGTGVTIAVLDSGVDYTHRNLGGPGTAAAYAAAYGANEADPANTVRGGLFPTAKVIEGFDFVGEAWPNGARTEDPDPIDRQGHGTHVADIAAGRSQDGTHVGMAPGAKILAVKVCSAVATSCNGIALLKGMDYALDPNGDGDTEDAADVINMSLGSNYGQVEDDLTQASANAVAHGQVVVAAAGNAANRPYIVSSPSIGLGVISVAQTQVPSAVAQPLRITAPAAIAGTYANTEVVDWAPVGAGVTGDVVVVGRGCPAGSVGAASPDDPYLANPAGKIALIDRGACSISLKVDRAAKAGATGVLIGLVAAGDAVSFSFGGGTVFVPTLVIQQSLSSRIKAQRAAGQTVSATISPADQIPLAGSVVGSSARGPYISGQSIKPEIGAPGASLSAVVGSGNGQIAFGGTSGATPMVAGAAALLRGAFPDRSPEQIKAMLMNSAETNVYTNAALLPGVLAPVTRIGAGELRVDRALRLGAVAWNTDTKAAALSFGEVEVARPVRLQQTLRVENFSTVKRRFTIASRFRAADDQASGAVSVVAPASVTVFGRSSAEVVVELRIDPAKLATWTLNGGSQGGNGAALDGPEYDGTVTLTSLGDTLNVPWHVLPRKAANTSAPGQLYFRGLPTASLLLRNRGAEVGEFDAFSLTGTSERLPDGSSPNPGDNFAAVDLKAVGVRHLPASLVGADYLEFGIRTWDRRAHPNYPAQFEIDIDTTGDGVPDFYVFNQELSGFGLTGQNVVFVAPAATGLGTAVFFADADLNSGNLIMTVPMNASAGAGNLGLAPGTTIHFSAYAIDNYFTGFLTDAIEGMTFTPGASQYGVVGEPYGAVAPGSTLSLTVQRNTVPEASTSESGLLMMYRRNVQDEADLVHGNR
jgi:subtilisin family serine protease